MNKPLYENVADLFIEMSSDSNATWLFWKLNTHNEFISNIAILDPKDLTKAEIGKLARGYKVLHKKGVIKRIRNKHYLINPTVVTVPYPHFDNAVEHWNEVYPEFKI